MHKLTLISVFTVTCFSLFSQSIPILSALEGEKDNWESWLDVIPVSGDIKVGLMYHDGLKKINPSDLYVHIPSNENDYLCLEISSRNGRYEGKLSFSIKDLNKGLYKVDLQTQYEEQLLDFKPEDLTVLASISDNCKLEPENYTYASWTKIEDRPNKLKLWLNSSMRTVIKVKSEDEKGKKIQKFKCKKIRAKDSRAYNCMCDIDLSHITENSTFFIQQIKESLGGNKITTYEMKFKLQ